MLRSMNPRLKLTGFLESFPGEQGLVLQIQWTDVHIPLYLFGRVPHNVSFYSSFQQIPYDSLSRFPPCELDISRCFSAAEFSAQCLLYLAPKIVSFVSHMAHFFREIFPPIAELKTQKYFDAAAEQVLPRRQDPLRQPRSSPLRSCFFYEDYLIPDCWEVRGWELRYRPARNLSEMNRSRAGGVSVLAISKLKKAKLDKEVGDCTVCLGEMLAIDELLTTPCDHIFHEQCILSWLEKKNTCPLCRSQLQD